MTMCFLICNVRCANVEAEFSQNKHFDADLLISEADVGTAIDKLNLLKSKRLGFHLRTVCVGGYTVADDLAYISKFKDELQLMLCEADGYSGQIMYQIHPVKTEVVY